MFAQPTRIDFADTRAHAFAGAPSGQAGEGPATGEHGQHLESADALEQMRRADEADRMLLGLVLCAAAATLVLAMAASLSI